MKISNIKLSKRQKLRNFLHSYLTPTQLDNQAVHPKYLFPSLTLKKIYKIRDIFLEFDEKKFRSLNLKEIMKMFRSNNIDVSKEEIMQLFFPVKSMIYKEELLDLNFFEFMTFAISNESDERFRNLMRTVKQRLRNQRQSEEISQSILDHKQKNYSIESESAIKDDFTFLPMNFNLLLDYFNINRKDREKNDKIELILKKIDDYMHKDGTIEGSLSVISKKIAKNEENLFKNEIDINQLLNVYYELMKPRRAKDMNFQLKNGKNSTFLEKFSRKKDETINKNVSSQSKTIDKEKFEKIDFSKILFARENSENKIKNLKQTKYKIKPMQGKLLIAKNLDQERKTEILPSIKSRNYSQNKNTTTQRTNERNEFLPSDIVRALSLSKNLYASQSTESKLNSETKISINHPKSFKSYNKFFN